MNFIYIVELMYFRADNVELLGKFDTLYNSYNYIENYAKNYGFSIIIEYSKLSEDQRKGSIIAVNNLKKTILNAEFFNINNLSHKGISKYIFIRCEINRRRKLTI